MLNNKMGNYKQTTGRKLGFTTEKMEEAQKSIHSQHESEDRLQYLSELIKALREKKRLKDASNNAVLCIRF
jgi:hypothetical protein